MVFKGLTWSVFGSCGEQQQVETLQNRTLLEFSSFGSSAQAS